MTAKDEARIRRAIHYVIQRSREDDKADELAGIFDLISYLKPEAEAIAEDETALTMAELVGCN